MKKNNKTFGILLSLMVLAILALPIYAADNAATVNASKAVTIDISAKDMTFNTSTITAPLGANVTINFDNLDNGVSHNFAVYTDSSANMTIYKGEAITGPDKTTYTFTAPSIAGTYIFRDDKYPKNMTGQFIVE